MKIAFIYDVIYPYVRGGAERRFWEIAKRLAVKGHEVHLFGMKSWDGQADIIKEGVFIHGVGKGTNLYSVRTGKRRIMPALSFTFQVFFRLRPYRFDIIDCNAFPYLPFFAVKLFSSLKNIPLVVTWQEFWGNYWYQYLGYIKGFIALLIERAVGIASKNIIVHSQKIGIELNKNGIKGIKIIPNGIDLRIIDGIGADKEKSDLIFVGRLIKDKNIEFLIRAVSLTVKEMKEIKCFIIGDGPEKKNLVELANKLNLAANVIFLGAFDSSERVYAAMKASKIFVFPSTREGFGIAVIEAMACGLPVITVDHPLNASVELIRQGENGLICSFNQEGFSNAIIKLLKDVPLRNKMSGEAKNSIAKYDWDLIANANEVFYSQVLEKK